MKEKMMTPSKVSDFLIHSILLNCFSYLFSEVQLKAKELRYDDQVKVQKYKNTKMQCNGMNEIINNKIR